MEPVKRNKRYKAKAPNQTIQEIKNIIQSTTGLAIKEEFYKDSKSMFHSCRISICSDDLDEFRIGTNGKGVTREYALASAYGEFMERLQNNALLFHDELAKPRILSLVKDKYPKFRNYLDDNGLMLNYNAAPDEKYFTNGENNKFLLKFKEIGVDIDSLPYLPFYSVFDNNVTYIPSLWITHNCTSNGMCAGNTPKEAIIQGICEIMERYALHLIYKNNLTLPSIPKELFKGNLIYNYITELESENWTIEIKDCSCGIGLPAIGVLIIDKTNAGYHFHIGADPSPITALERSLTEIYQGRSNIKFHDVDIDFMHKIETDINAKEMEIGQTFYDSTGQFTLSILSDKNSYEFKKFDENYGISDDKDLTLLVQLIKELGCDLFVRDVSFLGFPAFHIFIPGMSEIYHVFVPRTYLYNARSSFMTAHNLGQASKKELEQLIKFMELSEDGMSTLEFVNNANVINKDYDLLMFLLHLRTKEYKNAHNFLSKYINKAKHRHDLFYKCLRDIIYTIYILKSEKSDHSPLYKLYDHHMINEIIQMLEQGNIIQLFNISSCFDCDKCKISQSCKLINVLKVSKRIEQVFETNIPDQKQNAQYFV